MNVKRTGAVALSAAALSAAVLSAAPAASAAPNTPASGVHTTAQSSNPAGGVANRDSKRGGLLGGTLIPGIL